MIVDVQGRATGFSSLRVAVGLCTLGIEGTLSRPFPSEESGSLIPKFFHKNDAVWNHHDENDEP